MMSANSDALRGRQATFAQALATGQNIGQAAAIAHVTMRTGQRYAQVPAVRLAVRMLQEDALASVTRKLQADGGEMLCIVSEIARDKAMPPTVRLRAATAWLDLAFRATELLDLAQRVAALEAAIMTESKEVIE